MPSSVKSFHRERDSSHEVAHSGDKLGGGRDHGVAGVTSSTESISCGTDFDSGVAIRGGHLSRAGDCG